jgi:hypothetical protein
VQRQAGLSPRGRKPKTARILCEESAKEAIPRRPSFACAARISGADFLPHEKASTERRIRKPIKSKGFADLVHAVAILPQSSLTDPYLATGV